MEHIETARKALRFAGRPRRWRSWVWVLLVIFVNLGLSMSFVLMTDWRLAEVEQRIEVAMQGREAWLEAWRGELATARRELGTEVADLRSALTELRSAVSADGDLRSGLDTLGGRVDRIESMVTVLWRAPSNRTQVRLRLD